MPGLFGFWACLGHHM